LGVRAANNNLFA
jgi:hypothetical protein